MSKMIYRPLGSTGLMSGIIGLGGEWLNDKTEQEVFNIIDFALENGINYLDVFMPQPQTRTHIGNALKGRREKMIIQGHLCTVFTNGQYERTRDIDKIKASFEDLLLRLQTDYIDIGMIHYVDDMEDFDRVFNSEIIEYVKNLKATNTIHHIGISSHNPIVAKKAMETGLIDVLMFSINAAYDLEKADTDILQLIEFKDLDESNWTIDSARQELYALCERKQIAITVMKPLAAGSLLSDKTSPFGKAMTVTQCCHYALTRPGVASVLVGCNNIKEIEIALKYLSATDEDKDFIPILRLADKIEISGKCMYCNHCLPCPSNIDIAAVTKFLDLAVMQNNVPETVSQHYHALTSNASDCIMCGACEPNCPFGVKIRENMSKAIEVFKVI